MRNVRLTCLLVVIVAIGVFSGIAGADVIYSSFGTGDSFPIDSGILIKATQQLASKFTVSGNDYSFDQLEFAAGYIYEINLTNLSLRADNTGVPADSVMETFQVSNVPSPYAGKMSLNSVSHPLLQNGSSYWIVITAGATDTQGFWPTSPQIRGTRAFDSGSGWTVEPDASSHIYRVTGSPVPEPSSLLGMFTGLGSLGGILWRKRR